MAKFSNITVVDLEGDTVFTADEDGINITSEQLLVNSKLVDHRIVIQDAILAASVNSNLFVADARYVVESIREAHSTAADATCNLTYGVAKGTVTPANSTAQHATPINLSATANTTQSATISTQTTMDVSDRLCRVLSAAATNLAGCGCTIVLRRVI